MSAERHMSAAEYQQLGARAARSSALSCSEQQFQAAIVELAKLNTWRVYHPFDSRRSDPGWPDLVLARGDTLLFRELKTETGSLTAAQSEWLAVLDAAGANDVP